LAEASEELRPGGLTTVLLRQAQSTGRDFVLGVTAEALRGARSARLDPAARPLLLPFGRESGMREEAAKPSRDRSNGRIAGDEWGERWQVYVAISRQNRRAMVRTVWIVRSGDEVPRFVTCWVL